MQLFSTAFVVTLGLASVQPNKEAITSNVNDLRRTQQNFLNLFDSIRKNDAQQSDTYRNILEKETRREQEAFDTVRDEFRFARLKNVNKRKQFHDPNSHTGKDGAALKRDAKEKKNKIYDVQPVVEDVNSLTDSSFAVSLFAAAKSRYEEIKRSGKTTNGHEDEQSELRVKVCEVFARSPFAFDHFNIIPYKKNVSSNEQCHEDVSGVATISYELREVTVRESGAKFHEYLFVCPTWNYKQEKIVNFHISSEHGDERQRFAFAEGEQTELVAVAIVERTPEIPAFVDIDRIDELKARLSALLEPSQAICNLSAAAKERLCTIISSSKEVRYPLPKSMRTSDKEPQCLKQKINYYPWRFGISFYAWALECKVIAMTETGTTYGQPFEFHISLGVEPRQIFLCRIPIQHKDKILIFDHGFLDIDLS